MKIKKIFQFIFALSILLMYTSFTYGGNSDAGIWIQYSYRQIGWSWEIIDITIKSDGTYHYQLSYPPKFTGKTENHKSKENSKKLDPEQIDKIKQHIRTLDKTISNEQVDNPCFDGSEEKLEFTINGIKKIIGGQCCRWPENYKKLIEFIKKINS